jgi:TPR repeat protein
MGVAADNAQARKWFLKATDQGNAASTLALGTMYCLGCGVASATMATAFHGQTSDQYAVKRLCGSPMGDGTEWMDLIAAAAKLGCRWELETSSYDQVGLREGCKRMMAWLDAGHPVL